MLAGITTRDHGDPWPPTGLTSKLWLNQPTRWFTISDLTATQPGVLFAALISDTPPYGGDPYPHVITWQNTHYLEDGHHRLIRALIAGHTQLQARSYTYTA